MGNFWLIKWRKWRIASSNSACVGTTFRLISRANLRHYGMMRILWMLHLPAMVGDSRHTRSYCQPVVHTSRSCSRLAKYLSIIIPYCFRFFYIIFNQYFQFFWLIIVGFFPLVEFTITLRPPSLSSTAPWSSSASLQYVCKTQWRARNALPSWPRGFQLCTPKRSFLISIFLW